MMGWLWSYNNGELRGSAYILEDYKFKMELRKSFVGSAHTTIFDSVSPLCEGNNCVFDISAITL